MRFRILDAVAAVALIAVTGAAGAQSTAVSPPLTGAEFDAAVTGSTLIYHHDGLPYGVEQYLPERRVRWAFMGDACREGEWFERGDQICFVYPYNPIEQCWTFHRAPSGGIRGIFQGADGPSTELYEVSRSDQPLNCATIDTGV